jgi:hypothetical protein
MIKQAEYLASAEILAKPEYVGDYNAEGGFMQIDETTFPAKFIPRGTLVVQKTVGAESFLAPYFTYLATLFNGQVLMNTANSAGVTATLVQDGATGTYSTNLAIPSTSTAGAIVGALDITSVDISTGTFIGFWVKCDIATAAGDFKILTDDTGSCASATTLDDVPALSPGVWTYCMTAFSSGSAATISVGVEIHVDVGACNFQIGDVRIYTTASNPCLGIVKDDIQFDNVKNRNIDGEQGVEVAYFTKGQFFKAPLLGYDTDVLTDLGGKLVANSTILVF